LLKANADKIEMSFVIAMSLLQILRW
jgi:hypothetical protein